MMAHTAIAGLAVCCLGLYGAIRYAGAGRRADAITLCLCGTSVLLMAGAPAGRIDARAVALLFTLLLPVSYWLGIPRTRSERDEAPDGSVRDVD